MLWNSFYVCRQWKNHFDPGSSHDFVPPPQILWNYLSDWQNCSHMKFICLWFPLTPPRVGNFLDFGCNPPKVRRSTLKSTQYWKYPTIWNASGKIIFPPAVCTKIYPAHKNFQNISQIGKITALWSFLSSHMIFLWNRPPIKLFTAIDTTLA